jgi:hypothetical protein
MENQRDSEWVNRRLATLEPSERLQPNGARAFEKLRQRETRRRVTRRYWVGGMAVTASLAVVSMLVMPARSRCCVRPDAENYKESGPPSAPIAIEDLLRL